MEYSRILVCLSLLYMDEREREAVSEDNLV